MPEERAQKARTYRKIPAIDAVLRQDGVQGLVARHGRRVVVEAVREIVARIRARMSEPDPNAVTRPDAPIDLAELTELVERTVSRSVESSSRRVINATGVVVHTNLGRAVLSEEARARVSRAASGYTSLEYDLEEGRRGSRSSHVERRLRSLFPDHAALAVNNNAAAVFLALSTFARGREVIISRGELVEIGGSFRIPDVMTASGATLREVGTTNRTRLSDYEQALGPATAMILKVHPSNYRIVGFTQEVEVAGLSELAARHGIPMMVDQGSGCLVDLAGVGVKDEPTVGSLLDQGADLVTFSGDKLLGGPQAGVLVGEPGLIERMRRSPLYRVLRLDKMTLAALEATLDAYARDTQGDEIPVLRMIGASHETIARRASALCTTLAQRLGAGWRVGVENGSSCVGGGSAPGEDLPTALVSIRPASSDSGSVTAWEERLRRPRAPQHAPVVSRIQDGALLLDLRTVDPSEEEDLVEALAASQA